MAYILFLFVSLVWGASFILMKKADVCYGALSIGGWRSFAGAAVLLAAWVIRDRKWHFKRKHALPFLVLVLTSYLWPYTAQPYFIRHFSQSAFVGQIIAFVPLFTVIASVPLLKKLPTRRQWIGVIIGLVCYLVIIADSLDRNLDLPHMILLLTVPASYAIGNTVNKRYLSDVSPVFLAGMCMTLSAVIILPMAFVRETVATGEGWMGSTLALVMLGTQFWHPYQGGLYMGWYLPLLVLTVFRPNLEDRVALSAVGDLWIFRRRTES